MSLSLNEDSYDVFQCPSCKEYVSTTLNTCRFCSFPLTDETKTIAVEREKSEIREFRIKTHKAMLYAGIGIFAIGLLLITSTVFSALFTNTIRFSIWSPILTLLGIGQIIMGLKGIYTERKNKKIHRI